MCINYLFCCIVVIGSSMEEHSNEIVSSALHVIRQLCDNIISGNITMQELTVYHNHHMKHLEAICLAANSGIQPLCHLYPDVSTGVSLCFQMFRYVMDCCQKLEIVVKYCTPISSGGSLCMQAYGKNIVVGHLIPSLLRNWIPAGLGNLLY